jgi:hypothetical protein
MRAISKTEGQLVEKPKYGFTNHLGLLYLLWRSVWAVLQRWVTNTGTSDIFPTVAAIGDRMKSTLGLHFSPLQ